MGFFLSLTRDMEIIFSYALKLFSVFVIVLIIVPTHYRKYDATFVSDHDIIIRLK